MISPIFERLLEIIVRLRVFLTSFALAFSVIVLLVIGGRMITQSSGQATTNRQLLMVVVGLVIVSGVFLLMSIIRQLAGTH